MKSTPDALKASMEKCGIGPALMQQILRLSEFHTYPAPGVLIGAFMVDYALELLGVTPDQETLRCLRDAQVPPGCPPGDRPLHNR